MSFGFDQISVKTPKWAKWTFRIVFMLTTAAAGWVAGTNLIDQSLKVEIMLVFKLIDPIVFGLSKMFGVSIEKHEP
jgi:hypothetical protein